MYHTHFRSAITVRDGASFPCCNEFRYSHCKERLLDSVCACGHGLACYPPPCGQRQSSLIGQFAPKRVVLLERTGCCRSQGDDYQFFRLKERGERRRRHAHACVVEEDKGGGCRRFDYGLEIHRWVHEVLSLLVRFNPGLSPVLGKSGDIRCDESPFLRTDHDDDGESESRFSFEHWVSEEIAKVDVGRAAGDRSKAGSVNREFEERGNRTSRSGCRRDDEREDDDAGYEASTQRVDYGSTSKRQQHIRRSQDDFAVQDEYVSSDSKGTYRRDQTKATLGASDRHGVRKDVSEAESSSRASSTEAQRSEIQQITQEDRYFYENRRNKQQDFVRDDRSFSKLDEIKVCVDEEQNWTSFPRTAGRHRDQQILMKQEDSKVERRNVIRDSSVSEGIYSVDYRNDKSRGDSPTKFTVGATVELNQQHDTAAYDNSMEVAATDVYYTHKDDQRVLVNKRQETSTSVPRSAQHLKQTQVNKGGREPASPHPDSSVIVVDSGLSRLHESKEYVCEHCGSSIVDWSQQVNTSSAQRDTRISQEQISPPAMSSASSSQLAPMNYSRTNEGYQMAGHATSDYVVKHHRSSNMDYMQEVNIGGPSTGARTSEPATLPEKPGPQPSQIIPGVSLKSTGAHQSGRLATGDFVAKNSYSSAIGSQADASISGRITSQDVSICPPGSKSGDSAETCGDNQLPGYARDDYVAMHHHSVNVDYREDLRTSSQTGVTILGQVTLPEPPMSSSSKSTIQGSRGTADRQPAGYKINESCTGSLQIGSHVLNVQLKEGDASNQSEIGNSRNDARNEHSALNTKGSDLGSVIFLEKSPHESKQPSVQQVPQAGLPSQGILKTSEKMYLVEREKTSDKTTLLQQVVLVDPSTSTGDSVQDGSSEKNSKDSGMQSSWQSPASEIRGPSDEMWDVAGETFEDPSGVEILEVGVAPVSVTSGEKLTEVTATAGAVTEAGVTSSKTAIVKRSSRSLWSYLAEIVKTGWALRMGSHNSTPKSAGKTSSTESGGSEAWFSGHEPEDEEKVRKEKRGGLKEPPAAERLGNELICELNLKQGQEITDRTSLQVTIANEGLTTSPLDLSDRGSIRRRTSSLSDNQRWDSTINSASVGSLSASMSDRTSPDVIPSSTGIISVQEQRQTSEVGASSVEIAGDFGIGIKNGPGDARNKDKEGTLTRSQLKRTAQVQRERFEAWEEAYRLDSEQRKVDEMFMREALLEARKAADTWEVPVGAVLVQDGKVVARGCNLVEEMRDSTAHAEMICIREASNILKTWRLAGTTLYVTLEPCPMCAGAILQARIDTLVWGAPNKLLGADGSWVRLLPSTDEGQHSSGQSSSPSGPVHPFHPNMKIRRGILATECSDVMQRFFSLRRKKTKTPDSPPSCMPLANPPKFFSKMHDFFGMMFCL